MARSRLCVVPGARSMSAWTRVACAALAHAHRTGLSSPQLCQGEYFRAFVLSCALESPGARTRAPWPAPGVGVHKCAKFTDFQRAVCRRCGNARPLVPLELRNGTFCCGMFGGNLRVTSDNQQRHATPYYTTPTKTVQGPGKQRGKGCEQRLYMCIFQQQRMDRAFGRQTLQCSTVGIEKTIRFVLYDGQNATVRYEQHCKIRP